MNGSLKDTKAIKLILSKEPVCHPFIFPGQGWGKRLLTQMNGSREEVQAVRAAPLTQSAHPALEAAHVAPACPSSVLLLHKKRLTVLLPVSPMLAVWGLRLCSQLKEPRDHWQENVLACSPHWHVERPRPAMAVVTCIIPAQQNVHVASLLPGLPG